MTGATSSVAGTKGNVPAPSAGNQNAFLKGDGTWSHPVQAFSQSSYYSAGDHVLVGDIIAVANGVVNSQAFAWGTSGATWSPILVGSTWAGVYANNTAYSSGAVFAETSGITSVLLYVTGAFTSSSSGVNADLHIVGGVGVANTTSYSNGGAPLGSTAINFVGANATSIGRRGLVPYPNAGAQNAVLRGDGNWFSRAYGAMYAWSNNDTYATTYAVAAKTNTIVNGASLNTNAYANITPGTNGLSFTITQAGTYEITAGSTIVNSTGGNCSRTAIVKGVTVLAQSPNAWVSALNAPVASDISTIVSLAVGDVIYCCAWSQNAGYVQGGHLVLKQIN